MQGEFVSFPEVQVSLEGDDKDEARRAYAAGEYFKEVDISRVNG